MLFPSFSSFSSDFAFFLPLFPLFFAPFPIFGIASPSSQIVSCDGFGWTQWEGNCYKTFSFDLNFTEAEDLCRKFTSNLTSILSRKEDELVKSIVRDAFVKKMGEERGNLTMAFWVGIRKGTGDRNWTDGGEAQFGRTPGQIGSDQRKGKSNGTNVFTANESFCEGMEPKNGTTLLLPCNWSLIGATCKRKAVANLDEGIPYGILLNQTMTGNGRLNITEEKKQQMLKREQNLVEMINNTSKSDEATKGWEAKVHETFVIMSDTSKTHMLGIMKQSSKKGRSSSRKKRQAWPIQYQYHENNQNLFEYSNKLYERYAADSQFEYARHYFTPHQQYPQPQPSQYSNPEHMQQLYKEAYMEYDKRELESALRGYLHYITLAYAQPKLVFPQHYDLREKIPQCAPWIGLARDQGKCGACWAVATTAARDDRACIFLTLRNYLVFNNNPNLYSSAMDLISCTKEADGCNGGTPQLAWKHLENYGYLTGAPLVNGSGCKPYVFPPLKMDLEKERKAPECTEHCQAGWKRMAMDKLTGRILPPSNETRYRTVIKTNHWGMDDFGGQLNCQKRTMDECYRAMLEGSERGIMAEIYYFGSVVVSIDVYEDFYRYSNGIYRHTWGELKGGHAVKLIGWGEEKATDGTAQKYWLGVNSWNKWWGEEGLFKMARGQNESGIEWRAVDVGYIFF